MLHQAEERGGSQVPIDGPGQGCEGVGARWLQCPEESEALEAHAAQHGSMLPQIDAKGLVRSKRRIEADELFRRHREWVGAELAAGLLG